MENQKIKNSAFKGVDKQVLSSPVKRTFRQVQKEVEERCEILALPRDDVAKARELAMIIAEVELLPPDARVRIDGNDLFAQMVAEVFSELRHEHIEFVLDNLRNLKFRFFDAKTYVRTALYNSVFTLELAVENMVNADLKV